MGALGDYLQALAREKGLTLRAASLRANLPPEALSQLIRREGRFRPRPDTLRLLADALDGDFVHMMQLAGHLPARDPDLPAIPQISRLVDRLAALPPDRQARVMDAFLLLLDAQDTANEPQTRLLREPPPHD